MKYILVRTDYEDINELQIKQAITLDEVKNAMNLMSINSLYNEKKILISTCSETYLDCIAISFTDITSPYRYLNLLSSILNCRVIDTQTNNFLGKEQLPSFNNKMKNITFSDFFYEKKNKLPEVYIRMFIDNIPGDIEMIKNLIASHFTGNLISYEILDDNSFIFSLEICDCSESLLLLKIEKNRKYSSKFRITISCNDNNLAFLGPGYYAIVVEEGRFLAKILKGTFSISPNELPYLEKEEYDFNWLVSYYDELLQQHLYDINCDFQSGKQAYFCWSEEMYQPLPVPSTVITPLGRYSIAKLELEMQQNGFESMRNRFFIFNHFIKTADDKMRAALYILQCYPMFRPSERSEHDKMYNEMAINYLEDALKSDSTLYFPKEEYLELCQLDRKTPLDISRTKDFGTDIFIGYHRHIICYSFGNNLKGFPIFGDYLIEEIIEGEKILFTNCYDPGVGIIVKIEYNEKNAVHNPAWFKNCFGEIKSIDIGPNGICRYAFMGIVLDRAGQKMFSYHAEVLIANERYTFEFYYADKEQAKQIDFMLGNIKAVLPKVEVVDKEVKPSFIHNIFKKISDKLGIGKNLSLNKIRKFIGSNEKSKILTINELHNFIEAVSKFNSQQISRIDEDYKQYFGLLLSGVLSIMNFGKLEPLQSSSDYEYDEEIFKQIKYSLYENWEIYDTKSVFETIGWLLNEGHSEKYDSTKYTTLDEAIQEKHKEIIEDVEIKNYSDDVYTTHGFRDKEHYIETLLKDEIKELQHNWSFIQSFRDSSVKNIRAWDIGRAAYLVWECYFFNYLKKFEAEQLIDTIAEIAAKEFSSFTEFASSYALGRIFWYFSISKKNNIDEKMTEIVYELLETFEILFNSNDGLWATNQWWNTDESNSKICK
ncbi:DUF1266 domain-containing protein [Fusobacterium canifelinum]|uniref:DUF1266 domain-containing protein n=1 Tax=Fusobacterium canifelinum TaxID=285729 RepID=UPI0011C24157|nr:DUF1266 domain-containing protein [Fusobacterium canifelinum]